jgi:hypothetical protein
MQMDHRTWPVRGHWPPKKCPTLFFKLDFSNLAYMLLVPAEADGPLNMTSQGSLTPKKVPNTIFQARLFKFSIQVPCGRGYRWTTKLDRQGSLTPKKCQTLFFKLDCSNLAYRHTIFQARKFKFGIQAPCASWSRWTTKHDLSGVNDPRKSAQYYFSS